jgi:hypothetical protein
MARTNCAAERDYESDDTPGQVLILAPVGAAACFGVFVLCVRSCVRSSETPASADFRKMSLANHGRETILLSLRTRVVQGFFRAERRRSRTYPAWGCQTSPVLKPYRAGHLDQASSCFAADELARVMSFAARRSEAGALAIDGKTAQGAYRRSLKGLTGDPRRRAWGLRSPRAHDASPDFVPARAGRVVTARAK